MSAAFQALTNFVATAPPGTRIEALGDYTERIDRATRRIEVLTTMHPELALDSALPRNALTDEDVADRAIIAAQLDAAVALPTGDIAVWTRTKFPPFDGEGLDGLKEWADAYLLNAHPNTMGTYDVDVTHFIEDLWQFLGLEE